jgi:N-acetylglucosaminyldiphosphoundecaprenol N-acetyl-beta-D-mannosaminyltransferase
MHRIVESVARVQHCIIEGISVATELRTIRILNTPLAVTTYADAFAFVSKLATQPRTASIDFTNTHIVTLRRHKPAFREITSGVDYFIPDGMPLIWCLNARGAKLRDRVYGPTFFRYAMQHSPASLTHYFLGGNEDCLQRLVARMKELNPQLNIVGARNGYFSESDEPAIIAEINKLSPDFIWIGLGTPKQQAWIHRSKPKIKRGVIFAVGFAFDVNAGTKKDAPPLMQRLGLTWVYRLASEPRRLLWRYVKYNALFLYYLMRDGFSRKQPA